MREEGAVCQVMAIAEWGRVAADGTQPSWTRGGIMRRWSASSMLARERRFTRSSEPTVPDHVQSVRDVSIRKMPDGQTRRAATLRCHHLALFGDKPPLHYTTVVKIFRKYIFWYLC